jgi:hypothetical protein
MESAPLNLLVFLASYIIGISFFAYVTASISNFLDENLEEGKVFEFYGKWVRKEVWQNKGIEEKENYLKSCCQFSAENISIVYDSDGSSEVRYNGDEKTKVPKWKKPLGACVYCANTWVNIILVTIITFSQVTPLPLELWVINIIVASALSNTFLGKINK